MAVSKGNESGVWVHGYTTSSGNSVAGHWRRRGLGEGGEQLDETRSPAIQSANDGAALTRGGRSDRATARPEVSPTSERIASPASIAQHMNRVAAAEAKYKSALVAAGVGSLGGRGDREHVRAALEQRRAAKGELDAARAAASSNDNDNDKQRGSGRREIRCPGCGQFQSEDHTCPAPDGLPAGDYGGMKGEARVKAMVNDLQASVQAIVTSGQLQRWLDAMASNGLSRWSANNRLLAAVQMLQRGESLDGLHLMGFRQWEKFDRKVSKGAKAVWILAPITRRVADEQDDGTLRERHRVVGFKGVPVFDVSDTQGEPLPPAPVRPPEGSVTPGTLEGLRARVGQAGYSYHEVEIPGCRPAEGEGTLGYTEGTTKRIVIDSRLNDAQKASTIAHELGHVHCGHLERDYSEYRRHRGQMETEAEMTAYLVNRNRGMSREQVDAFSPGYIAGWSKGDPAVMHKAVDTATRAFNKITEGPWPTSKGTST